VYWIQAPDSIDATTAIQQVFPAAYWDVAHRAFLRIKNLLPFPCGIRQSHASKKDRISFLLGNYRLAALETNRDGVLVSLAFANALPAGFRPFSDPWVWKTASCVEGGIIINPDHPSVELNDEAVARFVTACQDFKKIAAKSRLHECDIQTSWSAAQLS